MSIKFIIIPVTSYQQNCTLLICQETSKAAIVDPGGEVDVILDALKQENAIPEIILVTHGHLDHVGAVAELASLLSIPVEGPHQDDKFWIDLIPHQIKIFGFPYSEVFEPDCWLNEGDSVSVGQQTLEVFHCPGHTPGHIVFFHKETELALVGDVLFKGAVGRSDFPRGDHATLIRSIKDKLWPLGKKVRFIPGHGEMSTFGEERKSNPYVRDS